MMQQLISHTTASRISSDTHDKVNETLVCDFSSMVKRNWLKIFQKKFDQKDSFAYILYDSHWNFVKVDIRLKKLNIFTPYW